jgi:hypothetical protein
MVKDSSDQFSKQFLEELLLPLGVVETSYEVAGEPQLVDDFVPDNLLSSQTRWGYWVALHKRLAYLSLTAINLLRMKCPVVW